MQQDPPFANPVTAKNFKEELKFVVSKWDYRPRKEGKPSTAKEQEKH